jgi:hypothetical protein
MWKGKLPLARRCFGWRRSFCRDGVEMRNLIDSVCDSDSCNLAEPGVRIDGSNNKSKWSRGGQRGGREVGK